MPAEVLVAFFFAAELPAEVLVDELDVFFDFKGIFDVGDNGTACKC